MQRPLQAVNEIVHDRKRISIQTALDLEEAMSCTAEMWLTLQMHYELARARADRAELPIIELGDYVDDGADEEWPNERT